MGLRCLLGHDFTEPRTERDREERGEEVVITVRDVKECRRCGETRVVSENKEVTTMRRRSGESATAAAPVPGGAPSSAEGDDGHADTNARESVVYTAESAESAGPAGPADPAHATDAADAHADAEAETEAEAAETEGTPSAAADASADDSSITDAESGRTLDDAFSHPTADRADVDPDTENDAEILRGGPVNAGPADGGGDAATPGGETAIDDGAASGEDGGSTDGRARGEWPDEDVNRGGDEPSGGAADEWPDPGPAGPGADTEADAGGPADAADASAESTGAGGTVPAAGESEDVEILGDDTAGDEGAAASQARSDVVPDPGTSASADDDGTAPPTEHHDAEFVGRGGSDGGRGGRGGLGADDSDLDAARGGSTTDDSGGWPAHSGEDEGFDAEVGGDAGDVTVDGNLSPRVDGEVSDDAEFIEADPNSSAGGGREPSSGSGPATSRSGSGSDGTGSTADRTGSATRTGSSPDRTGSAPERTGTPGGDGRTTQSGSGAGGRPRVELSTTDDRAETVYVCPECGAREPVGASSARAGDICRECKRGYIEERQLE